MYRPSTMSDKETDQVFGQVERFILASGSSPDLADLDPRQAMLSCPDRSNPSVQKSVLTRNPSSGNLTTRGGVPVTTHAVHIETDIPDYQMSGANLGSWELQNSAMLPSGIDNQVDSSAAGFLPVLSGRYPAAGVLDEMFVDFIINPSTAEIKKPTELGDHLLEPSITPSPVHAPLPAGTLEPRTHMEVPEMLSRFLRVDRIY